MDKGMKSTLMVLAILCIMSIGSAVTFFRMERVSYNRYVELEQRLVPENTKLREQLNTVSQEASNLKARADTIKRELEQVSQERDSLKAKHNAFIDKYNALLSEQEILRKEAEEKTEKFSLLERKISDMQSDSFWATLLKEKASLEIDVNNLREKLEFAEVELKAAKMRLEPLEIELKKLSETNIQTEEELKTARQLSDALSLDLVKQKRDRLKLEEDVNKAYAQVATLQGQLESLSTLKTSLEKELADMRDQLQKTSQEKSALTQKISDMETVLATRVDEIDQIRAQLAKLGRRTDVSSGREGVVELPPIIVKAEEGIRVAQSPSSNTTPSSTILGSGSNAPSKHSSDLELEGHVMTVNEEHNFVVVDLGQTDGIKAGMTFFVYRGREEIGRIEVIETRKSISAAEIKEVGRKKHIEPNDIVMGPIF